MPVLMILMNITLFVVGSTLVVAYAYGNDSYDDSATLGLYLLGFMYTLVHGANILL